MKFTTLLKPLFSVPRWKSERLSVQPKLTKKVLKAFVYSVNQIISNFIDELHSRANGKEFDVKKLYGDLTLDVLASKFFKMNNNKLYSWEGLITSVDMILQK